MKGIPFLGLLLLAATVLADDAAQQPAVTTVVVPVVGSVTGESLVRWMTDVELTNHQREEVIVALEPAGYEDRTIVETIEPGGVRRYVDVVRQAFGLDSALVPLLVRTAGRRPVTVRVTAYGVRGEETFPSVPIPTNVTAPVATARILEGLSFSAQYRTNVGLANLGSRPADVVLALQRVAGRTIAVARMNIPPGALRHESIQTLFPMILKGEDFSIVIETSAPDVHTYASVIENMTNFARFIVPSPTHSMAFQRRAR